MRLKLLRNIGKKDTLPRSSDNPNSLELPFKKDEQGNPVMYLEGEVAEFSKDDGEKLVKFGIGAETSDQVGPAPAPTVFAQQPIPVTVVETPKPHPTEPPANPPGNKDNRGAGGPPSSGDAPKGGK